MSIFKKLNDARAKFHQIKLKKTGNNKFSGYDYFELGDFLIPALQVFNEVGLCAVISFDKDLASMRIFDVEAPQLQPPFVITSPMGSAALKGCHEVQNIGAVETYQRRYLWMAALEIVEHDALDAVTGKKGAKDDKPDEAGGSISAPAQFFNALSPEWQAFLKTNLGPRVENAFEGGGPSAALDVINAEEIDSDTMAALWHVLPSKVRSAIDKVTKNRPRDEAWQAAH